MGNILVISLKTDPEEPSTTNLFTNSWKRVYSGSVGVQENISRKRPTPVNWRNVVFLYKNARQYSARIMQEKLLNLGWSVLSHLSYIAPSDFYLFCSQQNALNDKRFSKKRSGKNVSGKFVEIEIHWILFEKNRQNIW